ncbi:Signal transduction histidine kinase [Mucilaginibacter pineti]|uniref:histidine kinase n=1 Tax=Mucilaginibacter pineti TaxID=1391627 RepID=A0A1G6Z456_9SPHI|nr:HAMP domain-containing sensor histidine kinase [Mucilaginibacter pineti]SDD97272.1 Signal transduction histidine kinase [Mucilaginibacter pineti]
MSFIIHYFRRINQSISGPPDHFPLTVRIFHAVLAICIAALVYNIPLNLVVGLPVIALASGVTLTLVIVLYYLSRYRGMTAPSRFVFCLTGTCLFVVNFFLNSGIDGPTGYFFILMLVVMVAVVPVEQYWYWVGSNVLLLVTLHLVQHHHPDWVPYTYQATGDRYIDISSAYVTVVVVILACFYMIRRRYDAERLEAQQNAARLREMDAEKNKLFSIISHDLRSPLSLIQNYLEMLAEYELSDEERRDIKAALLRSTRGTLDMVNNVLHWSKSQMSGVILQKDFLAVDVLLEPQVQLFQAIAARKEIILESVFAKGTTIWGNADMLQLITRNLLNNAIKFTAAGGRVCISASCNEATCLLTVSDSGNGSPAQLTDAIFQLSAVSAKGTANESGVGLGLALCREYTTLLGGRIWFSCDAVSGATFFVELPANEGAAGIIMASS